MYVTFNPVFIPNVKKLEPSAGQAAFVKRETVEWQFCIQSLVQLGSWTPGENKVN